MKDVLSVNKLNVGFPTPNGYVHAVRKVSFNIAEGEVFGIVGESGCGKSVICQTVMNVIDSKAKVKGEVIFNGRNLLALSKAELSKLYAKEIALLPQHVDSLNPLMTIGAHIEETIQAHNNRLSRKEVKTRALRLLETFQFKDAVWAYRSYPFQLSGGMKQRALMAITFSCNPLLVIADEPTKGLDILLKRQVVEIFKKIKKEFRTSMLIITHDLDVAIEICDEVGIIYSGLFFEMGRAKTVLSEPCHPYTKSLLNSLPRNGMNPAWGFAPSALEDIKSCPFQPRCSFGKTIKHAHVNTLPVKINPNHTVWCCNAKN